MKTHHSHDRVLVAYDSRLGSTAEVAAFVGSVLAEKGASVEVARIDSIGDIGQYHSVVVGSAIRYDRWLPEAKAFVEANHVALSRVPVSMFFTCLALANGSAKGERKAAGYAEQMRQLLPEAPAPQIGGFAGVLDPSRGPWWTRVLLRVLSRVAGIAPGDYRDWDAIRLWADGLSLRDDHQQPCEANPARRPITADLTGDQ
jgi:menaquinone-dependent protoporphyrinogen oxidase